ncbi:acetoacetate--CoA ligase [Halopseudomonas nanhaiensis]|uniref:acetoacetate--CoA ligase n=1 Tax=Halopseudomonas nanhaiensis TaxID=2830842 RepID=UPI001CBF5D16|nr:acetoacetate--CoA ligase [Halopseudomonas nanhaiensis]UAW96869.1 acetoacetate--CoA ligase [Halopseudomonas nanhaiensis]
MNASSESEIVWSPSEALIRECRLGQFTTWLEDQGLGAFADYHALHAWSIAELEPFWANVWAFCGLVSHRPASRVLGNRDMPGATWFPGMTLNFAENLLRFADEGRADNEAIVSYSETRPVMRRSFRQLKEDVGALEAFLRSKGLTANDRVAGIVTNGYEAIVGMLAATSLGAIWSSASPDFGLAAITDRFGQIEPSALIVVNGYGYAGKRFSRQYDFVEVINALPSLKTVVSVGQLPDEQPVPHQLVTTWNEALAAGRGAAPSFTALPADHPVYILYSSGTTGKPKCIVHGAAGILATHAKELILHGDVRPGDRLLYFTTCGWMMWNWQASALLAGASLVVVDGSPGYPALDKLWQIVASERVSHFGTSARFLAECRKSGLTPAKALDQTLLRVVFSTGSPLLPEDYDWVYAHGAPNALLGSISGGTDICGSFVGASPLLPVRRGEIQCRLLGVDAVAFDDRGIALEEGRGELVCRAPLPSMPLYFWGDTTGERFHDAYFSTFPGVWAHGDFIEFTAYGGAVIYGRSDATLNPGGVRIGTAEIYRQVETVPEIKDSLVIGRQIDGDVEVLLLVQLVSDSRLTEELVSRLKSRIRSGASPRHVPKHIVEVADIPYTRSGKKVEIAVARLVNGHDKPSNLDGLANPEALAHIEKVLRSIALINHHR